MSAVQINPTPSPFDAAVQFGAASPASFLLRNSDGSPGWQDSGTEKLQNAADRCKIAALQLEYTSRLHGSCASLPDTCVDGGGIQAKQEPLRTDRQQRAAIRLRSERAAVIVRCRDRIVVDVNTAFADLAGACGCSAAGRHASALGIPAALLDLAGAISFPTVSSLEPGAGRSRQPLLVDSQTDMLDGEECRVLTFSRLEPHLSSAILAHNLAQQNSNFPELLCDIVPAPMFVLDKERRIVAASETLLQLLGYASRDFVGGHMAEFLAGPSVRFFKDVFWPSLSECGMAEDRACELLTGKNATLRARLVGRPVLDGQTIRCVTCVVEDMSGHHFSEAKFSALFALSPVPMLVRRLEDGRVLHTNPAFLSLTGYTQESLAGRSMDELAVFEPAAMRQRFERELRAGLPLCGAAMRVKAADGAMLDVRAAAAAVQVPDQSCALVIFQEAARGRFDEQQMLKAIETVMSDTSWFSRSVVEKLASVRVAAKPSVRAAELDDLTKREREVLAMISHGWGDAEIAARLCLTRSTVRNHVAALYSKIDVHSRSSAIVWARERALNVIHPATEFRQVPARRAMPADSGAGRARATP